MTLYTLVPDIVNRTMTIPDFIEVERCDGLCNPDAEGIYRGWKTSEKGGFKYKKSIVLAENAHLTLICPDSTLENRVVWKINGRTIRQGESVEPPSPKMEPRVTVDSFNTLYLYGVTKAEAGNYTCYVDDVRMQQVRVFVVSKGKILTQGKRTATSDLNHDNWDREDEAEDAGVFKKAPDEVLRTRVIKTAKRRAGTQAATPSESGDGEKKSVFGSFTAFSKASPNPSSAYSFLKPPASTTSTTDSNGTAKKDDKGGKSDEYYAKLKGLNESVSSWIKKHVDENPFINLKPIFADYDKYFTEIEGASKATEEKQSVPQFSFSPKPAPTFNFSPKKDLPFNSNVPKAEFSFGAKADVEAKPFLFNPKPASAPFTFTSAAKLVVAQEKNEDEEDEPPKVEFTPVTEEGTIYEIKCKVFVKKDNAYSDRGVGTLFLKPVPDSEKTQLIVRADTNLGKLLCNFILSSAMPTQRLGKKDVMVVCVPSQDYKPPPVPILLRVKSSEDADELLKTLEKHKR